MSKPTVYVETSVISYLASRPSRDLIVAGHQQLTLEWWDARDNWTLFISPLVLKEAGGGDEEAASRRLFFSQNLTLLHLSDSVLLLAERLLSDAALPANAAEDALHVAVAAVHGMDYLLTWNCRHIANATKRQAISKACVHTGYQTPVICTPEELMGENYVD
ncbi:MAG: type II toxin-antitoxin system VapC family toxin [Pedobacter sp.]